MSKKQGRSNNAKNTAGSGKIAPPKGKSFSAPGEFQPHNAKKEALGPNTNR